MHVTRVVAALMLGSLVGALAADPLLTAAYEAGLREPRLTAALATPALVSIAAVLVVLLTYPFDRTPRGTPRAKP